MDGQMLNRVDHVTIPGNAIRRLDVDYDHDTIYAYPQRYITGATTANYTIEASAVTIAYNPPMNQIERAQVKRRIYLFTDPSTQKVRALFFGFRSADAGALEEWADQNYQSVALDIEPSEVDVRWIAPPEK